MQILIASGLEILLGSDGSGSHPSSLGGAGEGGSRAYYATGPTNNNFQERPVYGSHDAVHMKEHPVYGSHDAVHMKGHPVYESHDAVPVSYSGVQGI